MTVREIWVYQARSRGKGRRPRVKLVFKGYEVVSFKKIGGEFLPDST